jgi:hypothetical protein
MDKKLIDQWRKLNNVLIGTTRGGRDNQVINFYCEGRVIPTKCFGDVAAGDAIALRDNNGQWYVCVEDKKDSSRQFSISRQYRKTKKNKKQEAAAACAILYSKNAEKSNIWKLTMTLKTAEGFNYNTCTGVVTRSWWYEIPLGVTPEFVIEPDRWITFTDFANENYNYFPDPIPGFDCFSSSNFYLQYDLPTSYVGDGSASSLLIKPIEYYIPGEILNSSDSIASVNFVTFADRFGTWDDASEQICMGVIYSQTLELSSAEDYNANHVTPYKPSYSQSFYVGGDRIAPLDLQTKLFKSSLAYIAKTETSVFIHLWHLSEYSWFYRSTGVGIVLKVTDNNIEKQTSFPFELADESWRNYYFRFFVSIFGSIPATNNRCADNVVLSFNYNFFDDYYCVSPFDFAASGDISQDQEISFSVTKYSATTTICNPIAQATIDSIVYGVEEAPAAIFVYGSAAYFSDIDV